MKLKNNDHKSIKKRIVELFEEKLLKEAKIKIAVGKEQKPIDKPDEIIFHIDI